MSAPYAVDVVMLGHFARDINVVHGQATPASGGAVYFGAMALRRLGLEVAVVTRLAEKDFPHLDELREAGIHIYAQAAPATSGIENTYLTADMDRRLCRLLGFAGPFSLSEIPALAPHLFIVAGIIAGEVDISLLRALRQRMPKEMILALDAQGFVRVPRGDDLILQDWADKEEGLALVDVLKVDAAEAEALTGLTDLAAAARTLRALLRPHGWREVVLTHAQGVLVHTGEVVYQAPWTARNLSGRTGRGDTCFASYLGARLSRDPETACRLAAAVTSLKMERPGPFVGTLAEVYQRMAEETLPPS